MSVTETINQINQACEDLQKAYKTLADGAAPAMDALDGGIGNLTRWKVAYINPWAPPHTPPSYGYWDHKPRWYNFFVMPIAEEYDPVGAETARKAAEELWGEVGKNDAVFKTRTDDIAATPKHVGTMIGDWLKIAEKFASDVDAKIPTSPYGIPTTGDLQGWKSSDASGAYASSVGIQNNAAKSAAGIMSELMMNCANFLSSMQTDLVNLAKLTKEQNDFYADLLTFKVSDFKTGVVTFNFVMDLIGKGIGIAKGLASQELNAATALGTMLNDSIKAVLKLSELDRRLTSLGEDETTDGWPMPYAMNLGRPTATTPETVTLRYNTQYFKDHHAFWEDVSDNLAAHERSASNIKDVPVMFAQLPGFMANESDALNKLSKRLGADGMGKGKTATADMAEKLRSTIQAYLAREGALAGDIYKEFFPDE